MSKSENNKEAPHLHAGLFWRRSGVRDLRHRHGHRFDFGVIPQGVFAEFAADAGHLESAKGGGGVEDVVAVDPHRSGPQLGGEAVGFADISCPNRGGQAVHALVAAVNHIVDVLERNDAHHGAEDFFAGDFHFVFHAGEYRRLDEEAAVADTLTAGEHFSAAFLAGFDVTHHPVELFLRHLRALRGGIIERIADFGVLHLGEHLLDEFVVNLFLDEQPRTGTAALALIEEQAKV